jgi:hypothetical protein
MDTNQEKQLFLSYTNRELLYIIMSIGFMDVFRHTVIICVTNRAIMAASTKSTSIRF